MKNNSKNLAKKKLMQEYLYLKTDYEYKNSILEENKPNFLKEIYQYIGQKKTTQSLDPKQTEKSTNIPQKISTPKLNIEHSSEIKKLYRKITKKTHPDVDKDGDYTDLYKEAVKAYQTGNDIEIYSLADKLGLEYEIPDEDVQNLEKNIEYIKKKISLTESTFVYVWSQSSEESFKKSLIDEFIKISKI